MNRRWTRAWTVAVLAGAAFAAGVGGAWGASFSAPGDAITVTGTDATIGFTDQRTASSQLLYYSTDGTTWTALSPYVATSGYPGVKSASASITGSENLSLFLALDITNNGVIGLGDRFFSNQTDNFQVLGTDGETAYYSLTMGNHQVSIYTDASNAVTASAVPLPPAVLLLGSGLAGLGLFGRKKRPE